MKKKSAGVPQKGKSPSQQIDDIIRNEDDWRGEKLSVVRALIKKADPALVEEVKWKKPSNPAGVPVGLTMGYSAWETSSRMP